MLRGSIPPTGIPLPFMSAGGTSLMAFMGAVGILLNISKGSESEQGIFDKQKVFGNKFKTKFHKKKATIG